MTRIKFNPGIYMADVVSHSDPVQERHAERMKRMEYMNSSKAAPLISGWWPRMTHRELDYSLGHLEEIFDYAAEHGQSTSLQIVDRRFGEQRRDPPIPDKAKKLGMWSEGNAHFGKLWDADYADIQLELMQKLSAFDNHIGFEQVSWGETSVTHKSTDQEYTNQLIRLMLEGKRLLPHTQVGTKVNFLGDPTDMSFLRQIFVAAKTTPGCFITNPDTVLQRMKGYAGDHPLDYFIKMYQLMEEFSTEVITSPKLETWDMWKSDTLRTIALAINVFGANHVCLQPGFDSRRDENLYYPLYFDQYIVPALLSLKEDHFERMASRPYNQPLVEPEIVAVKTTLSLVESSTTSPVTEAAKPRHKGLKGYSLVRPSTLKPPNFVELTKEAPLNFFGFPHAAIAHSSIADEKFPATKYKHIRRHKYATHQPWAPDDSLFMTYEGTTDTSFILMGDDAEFVKALKHNLYEAMWYPKLIDGVPWIVGLDRDNNKPTMVQVYTEERITIVDMELEGYSAGKSEGHITPHGDVLYTKRNGDDISAAIVNYDDHSLFELSLIGAADGFDTATLAFDGEHIVAMTDKLRTVRYKAKEDGQAVSPTNITKNKSHGLMTVDGNGREIFVQTGFIIEGARHVVSWDVETMDMTILLGNLGEFTNNHASKGMAITGHIGHGPLGYVLVSMYDPEGPHIVGFLKTDGSQDFTPIAYTYDVTTYLSQPHAVASPDGSRVVIGSVIDGVNVSVMVDTSSVFPKQTIEQMIATKPAPLPEIAVLPVVVDIDLGEPPETALAEATINVKEATQQMIVALGHYYDALCEVEDGR